MSNKKRVVVIGAGPAGSLAAYGLARRGLDVLLVESDRFPRWKVCGCCMGTLGAHTLYQAGLGSLLDDLDAPIIETTRVSHAGRTRLVASPGMRSVSRAAFDSELAKHASSAGAEVVYGVRAEVTNAGCEHTPARVQFRGARDDTIECEAVVLAAGLRSPSCDIGEGSKPEFGRRSHMGLGAVTSIRPAWLREGELSMFFGRDGYAGCVIDERGDVTWGAAVSPGAVRRAGSPGGCVDFILQKSAKESPVLTELDWRGTPLLSRRARAQSSRVYRIGDAAGYVEPITGEGMSWALASGYAVVEVVADAMARGTLHVDNIWPTLNSALLHNQKRRCGLVARGARNDFVMRTTLGAIRASPKLSGRLLSWCTGRRALT